MPHLTISPDVLNYQSRLFPERRAGLKDYEKAVEICKRKNTSFIHSSNFSIGVNILFMLNEELARQMAVYSDYKVSIEEIHHTKKLDAPSGTAISLAQGIIGRTSSI